MRRILAIVAVSAVIAGCGDKVEKQAKSSPTNATHSTAVPPDFLGMWKLSSQRCEPDPGQEPDPSLPEMTVRFDADHRYEMFVQGWRAVGGFKVNRYRDSPVQVQLDETMYEFELVNGQLENWSEGDAVSLCGNIFTRIG